MKNYKIKSGSTSISVDTYGAQLKSFNVKGKEYIWQRDPKYWDNSAPTLFPIVGVIKNDTILINGVEYHMGGHGFGHSMEYKCEILADNKLQMVLESNDLTHEMYPFDFKLSVVYEVSEGAWKQNFIIENKSDKDMPYFIGAHPGFNCPLNDGESYDDYTIEFENKYTDEIYRIEADGLVDDGKTEKVFADDGTIHLTHDVFNKGALLFKDISANVVSLYNKSGNGVKMDFTSFNYFGIWKMAGTDAPYVCLEPWTGMNDCYSEDGIIEHKMGVRFLKPGESTTFVFKVEVI